MSRLDFADAAQVRRYDEFVNTSPYGHCMQSPRWTQVKDNWQHDAVYLERDGEIIASLLLLSVKNPNGGVFMYAPRGPVCDLTDLSTVNALFAEAAEIAKERGAFVLRLDPDVLYSEELLQLLRTGLEYPQINLRTRGEDEHSFSNPRHHMILDLADKDFDAYFSGIQSKKRTQIRKTYKAGLQTRRVNPTDSDFSQALDTFYTLTEIMAQRQGITHRPKAYFARLIQAFPSAVIYQTYLTPEQILASSIVVNYGHKAFYMYAASSNELMHLRPSLQMNNEAIIDTINDPALTEYDFGGVYVLSMEDGLYHFKAKFCGPEGVHEYIGEIDLIFDDEKYRQFLGA